ncbi:MAG TPA: DUF3570 domain-containing protein [Steroidobacteraceae bacterium]|jgi:hypothetical protein|nr:DUF3570 domain-containing protein [Steroidobacteraceae bacterium]
MTHKHIFARAAVIAALLLVRSTSADVLPDNRADVFYSKYSGGGMDITGYSATARAKITENFAVEANYFIDKVSGASIDVLSQASVIKDERKQKSGTIEYLRDKTTYTASYTSSVERDYISNTAAISLSQDMFGDLTTVTLGFANTQNKVGENNGTANDPNVAWVGHALTRAYSGGVSQIITKNFIAGVNLQVITDAGYLANPYRSIRYLVPVDVNPKGYALGNQVYPDTHTSTAVQVQGKYYLPYRAAVTALYRYYTDTWGVVGNTYELDYTHPVRNRWIFEGRVRYYKQSAANFYSDLFPFADSQNFTARDQNLAALDNTTIGAKVTYAFLPDGWRFFKRGTVTLDVSRIRFNYLDFRNIKDYGLPQYPPGSEPLYNFNANVFQAFVSMYF